MRGLVMDTANHQRTLVALAALSVLLIATHGYAADQGITGKKLFMQNDPRPKTILISQRPTVLPGQWSQNLYRDLELGRGQQHLLHDVQRHGCQR